MLRSFRALSAVFTKEPRARWFLLANAQSAIGTGAAVVALVLIAYDRLRSPWAIALVLLADFLPVMLLGPLFGAAADRWSRRGLAIVADLLRAAAFVGLGLVDSFAATVALALVAGIGTALFSPAVLAALPSLAAPDRGPAVTSLYGATRDIGRTLGPLLAAAALGIMSASDVMLINGATFAVSAAVIALIPFSAGRVLAGGATRASIAKEAREGLTAVWGMPGVRTVLWASSAVAGFAAMANVGELLLARDLDASASGFALLMVAVGVGVVAGSLAGSLSAALREMKRRYLLGIVLLSASLVGLALAHSYGIAMLAFFGTGVGNGLVVVHERLIFHAAVPDRLMGRAFAVLDTLVGWGFAAAFIGGGALIAAAGARGMFGIAGSLGLAVWVGSAFALRRIWNAAGPTEAPQPALGDAEREEPARYAAGE